MFEQIAADAPLPRCWVPSSKLVESVCPDYIATISRLADDGRSFAEVIGERLPAHAAQCRGTLGDRYPQWLRAPRPCTSAARCWPANIATDPYWQRRREIATDARTGVGLGRADQGCRRSRARRAWPCITRAPDCRPRTTWSSFQHAARLAAMAIERRRAEIALRASEAQVPRTLRERAGRRVPVRDRKDRSWRSIRPS